MRATCICGRTEAFGRVHTCPHPDGPSWAERPAVSNTPAQPTVANARPVSNKPAVSNRLEEARVALTSAERHGRWRAANPEKHRERSRDHMRRLRAARRVG